MDSQLTDLLRRLEEEVLHDGGTPRVAREAGQFLNILIKASGSVNLLQVGLAESYLTLWMTDGVAHTGGMLTGVEDNLWQFESAREVIDASPHGGRTRLLQGDLLEMLPVLEGPFDFVFLDGGAGHALHLLHLLYDQISSAALICCDKAMSAPGLLTDYLAFVHDTPGLESILAPIGEGIEITYKAP